MEKEIKQVRRRIGDSEKVYSDDEIEQLIKDFGVGGAVIEILNELLAGSAKFYDYTQGQTTDRRSQVFEHLKHLLDRAKEEYKFNEGQNVAIAFSKTDLHEDSFDLSRTDRW